MAVDILMPELGESVHEGTVSRWLKAVGDTVKEDEPIVEIMTDKVNTELPSPAAGVLSKILIEEGQPVKVFEAMGIIEAAGAAPAAAAPETPKAPEATAAPATNAAPAAAPVAETLEPTAANGERRFYTPV
ncbi:2-oxoglutarate dehydrogenase, E2 component, dihydrolipoamide succinyltransferase, partial [bacterium]